MNTKPKILIFIDWYLPGYRSGGPVRSVSNMVELLKSEFDFSVVTRNVDFKNSESYPGIPVNQWIIKNGVRYFYLDGKNTTYSTIAGILNKTPYDLVYFNSLFSFYFTLLPVFILKRKNDKNKIIIAPRGMLGEGALNIKKKKKALFLWLTRQLNWFEGCTMHATTVFEQEEIRSALGCGVRIKLAPNISVLPETTIGQKTLKKEKDTSFVFISRIARKKNLLRAIRLFKGVSFGKNVIFDIYGPVDEKGYWEECKKELESVATVTIRYCGELTHDQISVTLKKYHFFILPTLNENYGHIIIEALASGCPVLISDQTPWKNLRDKQIGWDVSLKQEEDFISVIKEAVDMPEADYKRWAQNALDYARTHLQNEDNIALSRKLFTILHK